MAVSIAATRLQGTGANALELDNVGRHFGALVALSGITMKIAAGERRALAIEDDEIDRLRVGGGRKLRGLFLGHQATLFQMAAP